MMKQAVIVLLVSLLALGGGIAVRNINGTSEPNSAVENLPDFSLPDLAGQAHAISEWQGKIRIINFWATWCPPCLKEIPEFIRLQTQYGPEGLQFIGIAIDDEFAIQDFIKTTPINYPNLIGQEQGISLAERLGNSAGAVPFSVIVNQQGQIIHRQHGELATEQILKVIKPLLAATQAPRPTQSVPAHSP